MLFWRVHCINYAIYYKSRQNKDQVIIPGLNDSEEQVKALSALAARHKTVDKIELLPFRKMCTVKYESMGIPFPLSDTPEPRREDMAALEALLNC